MSRLGMVLASMRGLLIAGALLAGGASGCADFVGSECESDACTSGSSAETTAGPTGSAVTTETSPTSAGSSGNSGTTTDDSDGTTTDDSDGTTTDDSDGTTTAESTTNEDSTTEADTESSSTTDDPGPVCGNGRVEGDEDCDDDDADESDGCLSTCVIPRSCAEILAEVPGVPDGAYDIAPDDNLLTTACDMTTAGGGWTLVGKINHADVNDIDEPVGWFGTEINAGGLASPTLTLNQSPESHGAARFSPLIDPGNSLTRFELVEGGALNDSVDWFKIVATTASFEAWFSESDPDNSMVCNDVNMTVNCRDGDIDRLGSPSNNVTALGGMETSDYFDDAADFPIHIRQNNNNASATSGMISSTIGVAEWSPGYGDHGGNGLRIWLRE